MFKSTVKEYEIAILWKKGRVVTPLKPGVYRYNPFASTRIEKFDARTLPLRIGGQEVILADRTSLKINVAGFYKLADPVLRVLSVANTSLDDLINQKVQLTLRESLDGLTLDDLFSRRTELTHMFERTLKAQFSKIGLTLEQAAIKDVILPSDLRSAYVEAASASTRSKANLEYARGQSAALRHLANSASLIEEHPALVELLSIQKADKSLNSAINLHFDKPVKK